MKVLMLGNGFDLYHELLTDYGDFMAIAEYSFEKYHSISFDRLDDLNIYDELSDLADNNENIRKKLLFYEETYKETKIDAAEYSEFISIIHSNCWFKHFLKLKNKKGWVSFENEVRKVLQRIRKGYSNGVELFFDAIKEKHSYSNAMWNHISKYSTLDEKYDDIILEQYVQFIESLKLYLKIFVDNLLQSIAKKYVSKNDFLRNSDWVITFNYTDTYKRLYDSKAKLTHIHGNLSKEIIVGVNSDEYDGQGIDDTRFIKYKKYYQRINKQTFDGLDELMLKMKLTTDDKVLNVVGHSLDSADEDLITVIFGWFDKIVIYYLDESVLDKHTKNLKKIFSAKELSQMTFSQKIIFKKLPANEYQGTAIFE